jgi:hypothetical protein
MNYGGGDKREDILCHDPEMKVRGLYVSSVCTQCPDF